MAEARLEKLVLMLSSDQPGEVVAAAAAIGRALRAEGRDWHWMAGRLAGTGEESNKLRERVKRLEGELEVERGKLREARMRAERAESGLKDWESWERACGKLLAAPRLTAEERAFVNSLLAQFRFHGKCEPTERQSKQFVGIWIKNVGVTAAMR